MRVLAQLVKQEDGTRTGTVQGARHEIAAKLVKPGTVELIDGVSPDDYVLILAEAIDDDSFEKFSNAPLMGVGFFVHQFHNDHIEVKS